MLLAYIDPGSGALVWQLAVAGVMGLLFYLSKIRKSILRGISRLFRRGGGAADDQPSKNADKD